MTMHSFLTALSPIEHRHDDPEERILNIRETLRAHEQDESPFRDCPMVHMARLQIIDNLPPPEGDTSGVTLKSKYLLFVADIDGRTDDFLDHLYRVNAKFVHDVWGRCRAYPEYAGAVFFRRFIDRCRFDNPLGYAGFPSSVTEILHAVARKEMLSEWVRKHQSLSEKDLQKAWRRDREKFLNADTPKPGSL